MTVQEEPPSVRSSSSSMSEFEHEWDTNTKRVSNSVIWGVLVVVFIASFEQSIVYGTCPVIASDFHSLSEGSWLLVAYDFASCVALPVYGIAGGHCDRKNMILCLYSLLAVGTLLCGTSTSLTRFVVARMITGVGAAGSNVAVSLILVDVLPPPDVAVFRSYENMLDVTARTLGAPIGGFLTDLFGWQWAFLGQIPLILFCLVFTAYGLPSLSASTAKSFRRKSTQSESSDFDIVGLIMFAIAVSSLILPIIYPEKMNLLSASVFVLLTFGFILVELFWAKNPVIPMNLMGKSLGAYCLVQILGISGRGMLSSNMVPYFVRVENASNFSASSAYSLSAIGVTFGSLLSGHLIKRTARYKALAVMGVSVVLSSVLTIFFRWRDGCTFWERFILLPFGVGMGIFYSTQFMGMSSSSPKAQISTCISTYYLFQQIGWMMGPAVGLTVVRSIFDSRLSISLSNEQNKISIC